MSDEDEKRVFSKNLNRYINESGKQQNEVAKDLGFPATTFNTWCMGKVMPGMGKVQKIADYFGIGKTDLIDEKTDLSDNSYYINKDTREMANFLATNPEYKVLFDASRKVKKEDIEKAMMALNIFKEDE